MLSKRIFIELILAKLNYLLALERALKVFFEHFSAKKMPYINNTKYALRNKFFDQNLSSFYIYNKETAQHEFKIYTILNDPKTEEKKAICVLTIPCFIENNTFNFNKSGQYLFSSIQETEIHIKIQKEVIQEADKNYNDYKQSLENAQLIESFSNCDFLKVDANV